MASYKVMCVLTLLTPECLSQLDAVVCGQAPLNTRLLGGSSEVTDGEWPWMASLQKDGRHVCGGTLVDEDSVLSSADCFSNSPTASDWTVVLGRLKQNGSNPFEVTMNVTDITLSNQTGSHEQCCVWRPPPPCPTTSSPSVWTRDEPSAWGRRAGLQAGAPGQEGRNKFCRRSRPRWWTVRTQGVTAFVQKL
ncbi:hypothetical protein Q5P01_003071 [Channa striata]|uniref:Peptidase S1 domain-containing protein n=1 Tax=Channa striata TaxID=64152 RepID=A0AA88T6U8_CHASR|nr:hypothetical protein Q5P01_003071 [Channa striata]